MILPKLKQFVPALIIFFALYIYNSYRYPYLTNTKINIEQEDIEREAAIKRHKKIWEFEDRYYRCLNVHDVPYCRSVIKPN
jgi:hypothetical protein